MRASPVEYLGLKLRAHEVLHDVPLYDVSVVDLPGGGAGRSVADIRALDATLPPSRVANALFGVRRFLGRVFSWDRVPIRPEDSLLGRLSERDRRDSENPPRHSRWLVPFAVSVSRRGADRDLECHRVSWLTRPYLIAIEPFRRFILYPAMLRRIRRAWLAAYGATAP